MILDVNQFRKVATTMSLERATLVCASLQEICPLPVYKIDTPDIFHEFIANVLEECSEFRLFQENLNYKTPERLMAVWPGRFPSVASAMPYVRNPQKLANYVYGGRMGNTLPDDGWLMRGSGPIQLTGRSMITLFTAFYNRSFGTTYTVMQMAELLRTDLRIGIHSACWLFAIAKNLIDLAIKDEFLKIVKRINGGTTNLASRTKYYNLAIANITW